MSLCLHVECRDRYTHHFACVRGRIGRVRVLKNDFVSWMDARGGGDLTYWRRVAWLEFHANSCLGLVFCSSFRLCLGFRKLIGMRGISPPPRSILISLRVTVMIRTLWTRLGLATGRIGFCYLMLRVYRLNEGKYAEMRKDKVFLNSLVAFRTYF